MAERTPATRNRRPLGQPLPANDMGRLPPQSIDLEEVVLGALMLEKEALNTVIDTLKPEVFYRDDHQAIYRAIQNLFARSEPVDILTVTAELRKQGDLVRIGGAYTVTKLTNRVGSAANVAFHAALILQKYILRELIRIAGETSADAYDETTDVFDLLDRTENNLFQLAENNIRKGHQSMGALSSSTLQHLLEIRNKPEALTGVPSGLLELDRLTGGWQKSNLIIVAARPAMGKCLGKGTKVLMYDGTLRNVEDVEVGEQLMGDDSTPRNVLSLARGRENMYWVRQNRGMDYRVNESHILSLKRSRNEWRHKHGDVLNITVRDWLAAAPKFRTNYKGYKVPVEFNGSSVGIDPYFLGVWLGDGSSNDCRITGQDQEIIDFLHEYADELGMQVTVGVVENRCNSYGITRGRQGGNIAEYSLQDELRQLGVLGNKHIPQQYLINSTELRLRLLAGLIDSDGHLNVQSNGYEITQKNERLARQIKFLCDTLGFRTSLIKKRAVITSIGYETDVWRVRIYGDIDRVPVRVERKKALPWKSKVDWRMTGIEVEFDKEDDYYGFEIDGNRLFLLEDMTVTHNTAFVLSIARNAAMDHKKGVAFFSLEMASVELVLRLLSAEAEIDGSKLKKGQISDPEWAGVTNHLAKLAEAKIYIDDTPALTIFELRAKCRRLKAQHDIQLIIIDYLQLMSGGTEMSKGGNREQEIATISRALKALAKELEVPVIALSQLSRAVESRGGVKRPQLSDLRESGSIEQDADMVMFLYRPEYYGITETEEGASTQGLAQVLVAKHRNGPVGDVNARFIADFAKFTNPSSFGFDDYSGGGGSGSPFGSPSGGSSGVAEESYISRPSKMNDMPRPASGEVPF